MNLLFLAAIESISSARRHLEIGELRPCADDIRRAWEILQELSRSLDPSLNSDVKVGLESVFSYFRTRLMEANSQHSVRVLQEVESLLASVHQGWLEHESQPREI